MCPQRHSGSTGNGTVTAEIVSAVVLFPLSFPSARQSLHQNISVGGVPNVLALPAAEKTNYRPRHLVFRVSLPAHVSVSIRTPERIGGKGERGLRRPFSFPSSASRSPHSSAENQLPHSEGETASLPFRDQGELGTPPSLFHPRGTTAALSP